MKAKWNGVSPKVYEQTVTVECVQCGAKREIHQGDVAPDDVSWCEKCYMPMVAIGYAVHEKD